MLIANKAVLITGANRGIGEALVREALERGAARVYAAARRLFSFDDARVAPVALDVTNPDQIRAVADRIDVLDLLVNNAAIAQYDDLSERSVIDAHLAVNLFGPHALAHAFTPALIRSRGAIVNVLSIAALAAVPVIPAYSISKAAALSFSQSLRARLASSGVGVHVVLPGPVDTEMSRGLDVPKASPQSVARAIFEGVANGDEEIFPDPASAQLADAWRNGVLKAMERQNATLLQPAALTP